VLNAAGEGPSGRVWGAYDVVCDGPFVWQPSEVVWGAFVPFDEVEAMVARAVLSRRARGLRTEAT
jgi:hypothetical protein